MTLQGLKEKSSALLRSFNRDYLRTKIGGRVNYAQYWGLCTGLTGMFCATTVSISGAAAIPGVMILFTGIMATVIGTNIREQNKKYKAKTGGRLCHGGGFEPPMYYAFLQGPGRDIATVENTQNLVYALTRRYTTDALPDKVLQKLAPYLDDAAAAAARLEVHDANGTLQDSVEFCRHTSGFGPLSANAERDLVKRVLSKAGAEKAQAAAEKAAAETASAAVADAVRRLRRGEIPLATMPKLKLRARAAMSPEKDPPAGPAAATTPVAPSPRPR